MLIFCEDCVNYNVLCILTLDFPHIYISFTYFALVYKNKREISPLIFNALHSLLLFHIFNFFFHIVVLCMGIYIHGN